MPIVHFKGFVLPSIVDVNIANMPNIHWSGDLASGQEMDITTRIEHSKVDIEFSLNHYDETAREALLMRAWDLSRAAVDALCFANGMGLTVYIDTYVGPDEIESKLLPTAHPDLRCTAYAISSPDMVNDGYNQIYLSLIREPFLFMAMNDLITSIALPHHAAVSCARAVESIRNLVAPGLNKKQQWPVLREMLNVTEDYVTYVTKLSEGPRHADREYISGSKVQESQNRAWLLMNRFFEFRKRGSTKLPTDEFQVL